MTSFVITAIMVCLLIFIMYVNYTNYTNYTNHNMYENYGAQSHDTMSYNTTTFDDTNNTSQINTLYSHAPYRTKAGGFNGYSNRKENHPCENYCPEVCTTKKGNVVHDCVEQCKRNCVYTTTN
jgi:lipopolysaccharide export LptBFGC system permease protein LptF